jgi:protein phosphatase
MIRVAEYVARTDTGRQRASNEDSHLARAPVFVVADGMGGAQAGEVASQLAVAHFAQDLAGAQDDEARERLVQAARAANAEIFALSETDSRRAGMGTTLTAAFVGSSEVLIAHVGDSRAYRWRDGELERITEDHSLVEELLRQGRLTAEEAEEHPQRSIITRALGPEPDVEVDTFAVGARDGDVYLLCSDGLTSMVSESAVADLLAGARDLEHAADELVSAALAAGGRDNVTVVMFAIEEVGADAAGGGPDEVVATPDQPTERLDTDAEQLAAAAALIEAPPTQPPTAMRTATSPQTTALQTTALRAAAPRTAGVRRREPRMPPEGAAPRRRRRWRRRLGITGLIVGVLAVLATAGLLAAQSVYFIGTDSNGQITVYNGLPYTLPGGIRLYTRYFVSGITVAELSTLEKTRLFNNELRSQASATHLVSQLELGRISGQ